MKSKQLVYDAVNHLQPERLPWTLYLAKPFYDRLGQLWGNIDLCTGKTEAGFTGKDNMAYLSARATVVLNKAHLVWVVAVEHFTDGIVVVRTIKTWMGMLKRITVIIENLLECVFINAFHGSSLQTTIPEMA